MIYNVTIVGFCFYLFKIYLFCIMRSFLFAYLISFSFFFFFSSWMRTPNVELVRKFFFAQECIEVFRGVIIE